MADVIGMSNFTVEGTQQYDAAKKTAALNEKLQQKYQQKQAEEKMKPKGPVTMPPQLIKELNKQNNSKDRAQVVKIGCRVDKYYTAFGETVLKARKRKNFTTTTTLAEAQDELWAIENELGSFNAYQNCENLFINLASTAEQFGGFVGLQLQGLEGVVKNEKNMKMLRPELTEISIKYDEWFSTGPALRLAQKVVFMVKAVHKANVANMAAAKVKEAVSPSVTKKYTEMGL
jgi:hypothetical protein